MIGSLPALRWVGLRASINWGGLVPLYWVSLGLHSILAAVLIGTIALGTRVTIAPVFARFTAHRERLLIFIPFVVWVFWKFGWYNGLIWVVVAVVSTELYDRNHGDLRTISKRIWVILPPAAYFFCGLILVFVFNDIIVAAKAPDAYDQFFLNLDSHLLHGFSVSSLVKNSSFSLSPHVLAFAEVIYYRMFDQVGATILLLALCKSTKQALRFVGTLLTAYYLGLLIFYLWPSMGPFYTCPDHFTHFPNWLKTYEFQRNLLLNARWISSGRSGPIQINTDYFIAFPSLHVAIPIIIFWFLRGWKRIGYFLIAYDLLLIPAILVLEWHYVVDLFGGAAVGVISILVSSATFEQNRDQEPAHNFRRLPAEAKA